LAASVSLAARARLLSRDRSSYTHYDHEASVNRFVGPKRIVGIAGVYEAGVAAVA
jgi:hypothetical protein